MRLLLVFVRTSRSEFVFNAWGLALMGSSIPCPAILSISSFPLSLMFDWFYCNIELRITKLKGERRVLLYSSQTSESKPAFCIVLGFVFFLLHILSKNSF